MLKIVLGMMLAMAASKASAAHWVSMQHNETLDDYIDIESISPAMGFYRQAWSKFVFKVPENSLASVMILEYYDCEGRRETSKAMIGRLTSGKDTEMKTNDNDYALKWLLVVPDSGSEKAFNFVCKFGR